MIATIAELKSISEFSNISDNLLKSKLEAIETFIRSSYTNNRFQNRNIKFHAQSEGNRILTVNPYLKVNDTIEIIDGVNKGLYAIQSISATEMVLDKQLFSFDNNYIIKIEYPADVKEGCLDMLKWVFDEKEKVGLKSETISRHSVTYEDSSNFVNGYPKSILGFLDQYRSVRF